MRSCHSATELLRLSGLFSAALRCLDTSPALNWLASRTRSVAEASLLLAWLGVSASGVTGRLRSEPLAVREGALEPARLLTIMQCHGACTLPAHTHTACHAAGPLWVWALCTCWQLGRKGIPQLSCKLMHDWVALCEAPYQCKYGSEATLRGVV